MKQIIDGKRYDTETATLIGEADSLHAGASSTSDFNYWEAGLYRTPRGNYFLAGEGGPMTQWARSVDQNSRSGGSGIIVLDAEDAMSWAERHRGRAFF